MSIKPRRPRKINKGINRPDIITVDTSSVKIRRHDEFDFLEGTDTSIIAKHLVKGYPSRREMMKAIAAEITATNGVTTRLGNKKNFSSLVYGVVGRLEAKGYKVQSVFVMVPPDENAPRRSVKKKSIKRL